MTSGGRINLIVPVTAIRSIITKARVPYADSETNLLSLL